ncbi:uncharacterized protein Y057_1463 [Fusarium fujikuroi]|nr:uncharacterized protein Y057_1463 [Fusarium fujikuroi]
MPYVEAIVPGMMDPASSGIITSIADSVSDAALKKGPHPTYFRLLSFFSTFHISTSSLSSIHHPSDLQSRTTLYFFTMSQYKEIQIIMSSKPCTTNTTTSSMNNGKISCHDCLFGPLRSWAKTKFGKKPTYVELHDDFEPLLDEKRAPRPIYEVSKIMRTATPRTIKRYNRLP